MEKLIEIIREQQQGHKNDDVFMIGEQLKDMASSEPAIIDILKDDLTVSSMSISKAAEKIKEYSDKNRGKQTVFCVTPIMAEKILRDFYGLPQKAEEPQTIINSAKKIDLSDFL